MIKIIPFSSYAEPVHEWTRDDLESASDPDPADVSYSKDQKLFEMLYEPKNFWFYILQGAPQVGGGIWVLIAEDYPPDKYWLNWDPDYEPDADDCVTSGSWEDWATDLWKEEKNRIGKGLADFEHEDKILIKIDPKLRDYLVDEIDSSMSHQYEVHQGERRFQPSTIFGLNLEKMKELKQTLFFLENYQF